MSEELYSEPLLALAKNRRFSAPLSNYTHKARITSAMCGDDLELFLQIEQGRCVDVGYKAQACILCKASANVMANALLGQMTSEVTQVRESLEQAIATGDTQGAYAAFGVLTRFPSRQSCALLPWQALERAMVRSEIPDEPSAETSPRSPAQSFDSADAVLSHWQRMGQACVLATLISVDGSSPSPLGSHMVVSESGAFWGSVSGGCVESAVVAASLELLKGGNTKAFERLSFAIANSQAGEVGLPCGGQIQVYLQRAFEPTQVKAWTAAIEDPALHFRITRLDGSRPVICRLDGKVVFVPLASSADVTEPGRARADDALARLPRGLDLSLIKTEPLLWESPDEGDYFIEPLACKPPLVIVGGTHVAQKLSELCQPLGFAPVIIEPRAALAAPERFLGAKVIMQAPHDALPDHLGPDSAVVMLTHNPMLDDPALKLALPSQAYYVGALGSRKTQRARLERLAEAGLRQKELDRLHGPVGLAIGAKGAAEIALSILAQVVQARRMGKVIKREVGAVVLAAGKSTRFGEANKLLAPMGDSCVLAQVVSRILAAGIGPCVVVLGHERERVREALAGMPVEFVENESHSAGMGRSVALGIAQLAKSSVDAAFVVLGDMPYVRVQDYEALAAAHRSSTQHLIVAPEAGRAKDRRLGNPILWPRRYFDQLMELKGDRGAKALLLDAPGAVLRLFVDHPGVLDDVDRPEDLGA